MSDRTAERTIEPPTDPASDQTSNQPRSDWLLTLVPRHFIAHEATLVLMFVRTYFHHVLPELFWLQVLSSLSRQVLQCTSLYTQPRSVLGGSRDASPTPSPRSFKPTTRRAPPASHEPTAQERVLMTYTNIHGYIWIYIIHFRTLLCL